MDNLESKGCKVTIDLVKANIFSIVILVVAAIAFLIPYFLIWKDRKPITEIVGGFGNRVLLFFIVMIVGVVVHELIHGVVFACFAKSGWKSIRFGILRKMFTPYCHCNEPMRIPGYMLGAMMPCIILGIIPSVVALFIGSLLLLLLGILFIATAAGDIWITWLLTKENPKSLVLDHPSEAGFYVFDEEKEQQE